LHRRDVVSLEVDERVEAIGSTRIGSTPCRGDEVQGRAARSDASLPWTAAPRYGTHGRCSCAAIHQYARTLAARLARHGRRRRVGVRWAPNIVRINPGTSAREEPHPIQFANPDVTVDCSLVTSNWVESRRDGVWNDPCRLVSVNRFVLIRQLNTTTVESCIHPSPRSQHAPLCTATFRPSIRRAISPRLRCTSAWTAPATSPNIRIPHLRRGQRELQTRRPPLGPTKGSCAEPVHRVRSIPIRSQTATFSQAVRSTLVLANALQMRGASITPRPALPRPLGTPHEHRKEDGADRNRIRL
jgi:hypothetical protein